MDLCDDLFEHVGADAADRTFEAFGQRISFIDVAADHAFPADGRACVRFFVRLVGRGVFRALAFDDLMIIRISHRGAWPDCFHRGDLAEEDGVGSGLHRIDELADDEAGGILDDRKPILHLEADILELVRIAGTVKAEGADEGRIAVFGEDGDRESSALADAGIGVIVVIDADGDRCG